MAKVGEEEVEYESDPEEEKRLLGMRRREAASDDEEGEGEDNREDDENKRSMERRVPIQSDESDGQGGAADYDDEEDELLDEDEEEVYEDEEEELGEEVYEEEEGSKVGGLEGGKEENSEEEAVDGRKEEEGNSNVDEEVGEGEGEEGEEVKKESEPFAVPTAGAFYMHDDRFRDNAGGRHRRTYGGRKLWESKDDKKWGHDKFEELQERHYEQGRKTSRGRGRGRGGRTRGPDNGYARRNRSKTFGNGNSESQAPKSVRGRGSTKYETTMKYSSQAPPVQNRQPGKGPERTSHGSSGRSFTPASNTGPDQAPSARKNSSLNSASPPFYPSRSSTKDTTLSQKRDVQAVSTSRNFRTSGVDESFSAHQTNALMRGKNIADSVGLDKLHIDDSITPATGKPLNNVHMPLGASLVNSMHSSQSRAQGRAVGTSGQMTHQPTPSHNQLNRVSPTTQMPGMRNSGQSRARSYTESASQLSRSGSQASSPPKAALSVNSYEVGEVETTESSKPKTSMVGKGKGSIQGNGRGSFLYGGSQVMGGSGNMGVGDPNFPAFLPVMQFGGQHPGGMGVPAVGMAFPGYVAQPQLGLGNSEMTWLPVLAGAAGALGASYCPPYLTVDGAYNARPPGQISSLGSSSKENNSNKPNNEWGPSQRSELVGDELGQRQKPRRYSEMDFKQPSTST